jgi:hypothetical protein
MTFRTLYVFVLQLVCAFGIAKVGSIMNKVAMSANGGKMPYWADWAVHVPENATHVHETTKEMNLWPLCDIIFGVMSIGDIFIFGAAYLFAYAIIELVRSAWKWSFS